MWKSMTEESAKILILDIYIPIYQPNFCRFCADTYREIPYSLLSRI